MGNFAEDKQKARKKFAEDKQKARKKFAKDKQESRKNFAAGKRAKRNIFSLEKKFNRISEDLKRTRKIIYGRAIGGPVGYSQRWKTGRKG